MGHSHLHTVRGGGSYIAKFIDIVQEFCKSVVPMSQFIPKVQHRTKANLRN